MIIIISILYLVMGFLAATLALEWAILLKSPSKYISAFLAFILWPLFLPKAYLYNSMYGLGLPIWKLHWNGLKYFSIGITREWHDRHPSINFGPAGITFSPLDQKEENNEI